MKILVLNGSPKRDKSDTMHMTRSFLTGINDILKNDVHIIDVIDKKIEYCTGCFECMKNGGMCIHQDDMHDILNEIIQSDILILSFPLYCYGMPAPLKALMDRTLPLGSMAMQKVGERYEHVAQAVNMQCIISRAIRKCCIWYIKAFFADGFQKQATKLTNDLFLTYIAKLKKTAIWKLIFVFR